MKLPPIEKLYLPAILSAASHLQHKGKLARSKANLVYLNINDAYIYELFPLLQSEDIKMPDYFGEGEAGAHISVVYPEENKEISDDDIDQEHVFLVKELVTVKIDQKIYYVFLVESSSLLQLRRKYGLPDLLSFKNYSIGFHITIGTSIELNST